MKKTTTRVYAALGLVLGFCVADAAFAIDGKGMTWGRTKTKTVLGITEVGCHSTVSGVDCNPYVGDTSCQTLLPVLCIAVDQSVRPNYGLGDGTESGFYHGWAGGHIAQTNPVVGLLLNSETQGDNLCKATFGPGWRMAEFHDGKYIDFMDTGVYYGDVTNWHSPSPWEESEKQSGGWGFWAYGKVSGKTRFWVKIGDAPGNCWNN